MIIIIFSVLIVVLLIAIIYEIKYTYRDGGLWK
jgi:hypothetical protein